MNDEQKKVLFGVVRDSVKAAVTGNSAPSPKSVDPELNEHCGCFVTLKNSGRLRGCIGQFTSDKPLIELVSEMAVSAARRDPRFVLDPIGDAELEMLEIEISVLSELKLTENPEHLRLGIDGIYIVQGNRSGCFLPQVATECNWTEEQFLSYCCIQKAQLPGNAWKDSETEVYLFSADVFSAEFNKI